MSRNVATTLFTSLFLCKRLKLKWRIDVFSLFFIYRNRFPSSFVFFSVSMILSKDRFLLFVSLKCVCVCCASALTQRHPSRGFYVIRTFYSCCKQIVQKQYFYLTLDGAVLQILLDNALSQKLSQTVFLEWVRISGSTDSTLQSEDKSAECASKWETVNACF